VNGGPVSRGSAARLDRLAPPLYWSSPLNDLEVTRNWRAVMLWRGRRLGAPAAPKGGPSAAQATQASSLNPCTPQRSAAARRGGTEGVVTLTGARRHTSIQRT
jgi:hypothetical protein